MRDRFERSKRKRNRARLDNLVFLRASAEDFLVALPEAVLLEDIFILFPDPWPKRRHHKNRLIRPAFLTDLANQTLPEARLHFRTDHLDYFRSAEITISEHRSWKIDPAAAWPFELETVFQSRAPAYESLTAVRTQIPAI
jgi:tRNA (guanine-N7-)-methyltransferase